MCDRSLRAPLPLADPSIATQVKIAPEERRPPRLNRAIWKHFVATHQPFGPTAVVYDGRNMAYAAAKLPPFNDSFRVDLPESDGSPASKGNIFKITVSYRIPETNEFEPRCNMDHPSQHRARRTWD